MLGYSYEILYEYFDDLHFKEQSQSRSIRFNISISKYGTSVLHVNVIRNEKTNDPN